MKLIALRQQSGLLARMSATALVYTTRFRLENRRVSQTVSAKRVLEHDLALCRVFMLGILIYITFTCASHVFSGIGTSFIFSSFRCDETINLISRAATPSSRWLDYSSLLLGSIQRCDITSRPSHNRRRALPMSSKRMYKRPQERKTSPQARSQLCTRMCILR